MSKRFRSLGLVLTLALIVSMLPLQGLTFAAGTDVTLVSLMQEASEPVTLYLAESSNVSTLDPQIAEDSVSIDRIEQLFLALTDTVSVSGPGALVSEIGPELATDWSYDNDTLTWTFTIRDDVPWVQYDPVTQEATVLRNLVAGDFVTGIHRACDPNIFSYYGTIVGSVVAGCEETLNTAPEDFSEEMFDNVGVAAPDDTTLQVTLAGPRGYFFSMTPMWVLRAVPGEVVSELGDEWTQPGNIVTNGPYMLDEWVRGVRMVMVRNPYIPEDLWKGGNVERVIWTTIEDGGTVVALYQDNQLDLSGVPAAETQAILADPVLSQEVVQVIDLAVFYFGFMFDKPPFDDVHARRAFSASINRELFVSEVINNRGIPMMHFTPPGMFGAVPINEVGIDGAGLGFDPDFALSEIEAAGFPNCEGFPNINIVTYASAADWAEFLQAEVENNLGCDPGIFSIEQLEFSVLLQVTKTDTPTEERPNMFTLGWGPDYADANNWVNDVLQCELDDHTLRPCDEVDELILEAQAETDPDRRIELYRQIEEMFFGYDGLFPIAPLYMRATYSRLKPWVTWDYPTDNLFGGYHLDSVIIDQEAQLAARAG